MKRSSLALGIVVGIIVVAILIVFWTTRPTTTKVRITKAYVLTTNDAKGRDRIRSLRKNFERYRLPPLVLHDAPDPEKTAKTNDPFIKGFSNHFSRNQMSNTLGFYQILQRIAEGPDRWCYIFEDDARVVNCPLGTDLVSMRVPRDAHVVTVGVGRDDIAYLGPTRGPTPTYTRRTGGGMAHATLVSREGARRLVQALRPIWHRIDMVLVRCDCDWKRVPDEWQTETEFRDFDALAASLGTKNDVLHPCVFIYYGTRLFEQTSSPTPPSICKIPVVHACSILDVQQRHARILEGRGGYVIDPLDWKVEPTSL